MIEDPAEKLRNEFQIGNWFVEPQLNTIQKGATSKKVEPKVMDLLVFFAKNQGQLLERSHILHEVWPDAFVTDNALHFAIVGLRKALEDVAKSPRYLETVPKRGYRLIAPVSTAPGTGEEASEETPPIATAPSRRRSPGILPGGNPTGWKPGLP